MSHAAEVVERLGRVVDVAQTKVCAAGLLCRNSTLTSAHRILNYFDQMTELSCCMVRSMATDDEYLIELAQALANNDGKRAFKSKDEAIKIAKDWLSANHKKLQEVICNHPTAARYMSGTLTSDEELVKALADALSAIYTFLPCATIAQYAVKRGLARFCER